MTDPQRALPLGFYDQTVKRFFVPPEEEDQDIHSIYLDGKSLWCGGRTALWEVKGDQIEIVLRKKDSSPVHALCVHGALGLLVGCVQGLFRRSGNALKSIPLPKEKTGPILHLSTGSEGETLCASKERIFLLDREGTIRDLGGPPHRTLSSVGWDGLARPLVATDRGIWMLNESGWEKIRLQESLGYFLERQVRDLAVDGAGQIWATQGSHLAVLTPSFHWHMFPPQNVPVDDIRRIAVGPRGEVWIATSQGAARLFNGRWAYFASKRWLPDDEVRDIAIEQDGTAFIATSRGISRIGTERMTLEKKTEFFEDVVKSRHWRYGLVAMSILDKPGDLSSWRQEASDNDGCWTSAYLSAECFRYAATGSEEAKKNAVASYEGMSLLEKITPIPGLVARSVYKKGEKVVQSGGEWHETEDGEWIWKGDTSSDEMAGDYFAWSIFYDLVADEKQKRETAQLVSRVMDHLMDHDFNLVDVDGEPTTWGIYSPAQLNSLGFEPQKGLNSLEILSHLKATYHMTGNDQYQKAYLDLVENHHYAFNTIDQQVPVPKGVPWDHQLAMLSFYPLLRYEKDPFLRNIYLQSLENAWKWLKREHCPFWTFIYASITAHAVPLLEAVQWLQDVPMDMVTWNVKNSVRKDLLLQPERDYSGQWVAKDPIPMSERRLSKLDKAPYRLDGGTGGRTEDDGAFFLLSYWIGRYLGFLKEASDA